MTEAPDEMIVERVKSGDKNAFSKLVIRYQQKVFQTCLGFLHEEDDANDLTQEIFIRAYQKLDLFRGNSKFSTWLYRISVNMASNALRRKKLRTLFRTGGGSKEGFQTESNEHADDRVNQSEQRLLLKQALGQLTHHQKKVFVLTQYRDLTNQEAAEVLGLTVKAVESLLHRGRVRLKDFFKNKIKGVDYDLSDI